VGGDGAADRAGGVPAAALIGGGPRPETSRADPTARRVRAVFLPGCAAQQRRDFSGKIAFFGLFKVGGIPISVLSLDAEMLIMLVHCLAKRGA
jgi:hypothetical protein